MKSTRTAQAGSTIEGGAAGPRPVRRSRPPRTPAQRGQVLVLYVMSIFVILGLLGIVIDISWYWTNSLRVQRAADAAALAGAVDLPKSPGTTGSHPLGTGIGDAIAEEGKNGYTSLTLGCSGDLATSTPGICARQDPSNHNQLNVSISAPVGTFFMRLFGIQTITAARTSKALFTLPVPMGSPENYYGVFGPVRNATMSTTTLVANPPTNTYASGTAGPSVATTSPGTATWTVTPVASPTPKTLAEAVATAESTNPIYYAQTNTNGAQQQWGGFGFLSGGSPPIPAPVTTGNPTTTIDIVGLQVVLTDARISADCTGNPSGNRPSTIGVDVSWNGGAAGSWSTRINTGTLPNSATSGDYTLGNNNNTTPWGAHAWSRDDFSDANFRVRLTGNKGTSCAAGIYLQADQVQVLAYYQITTATITYSPQTNTVTSTYALHGPGDPCPKTATTSIADCYLGTPAGGGQTLNPRGFWATQNTQGAANVNGDAYQPFYDTPTSTAAKTCPSSGNACYDPVNYYNYGISMPAGTTDGKVYIFDPVFCATSPGNGTGDRWFSGTSSVSSWYELYSDPQNTPWDLTDDTQIATSGATFQGFSASDTTMGGSGGSQCKQVDPVNGTDTVYGDARDFHDSWYLLASGLTGGSNGTTYRLHTTQSGPVNQKNTNGEQSFAIFADNAEGRSGATSRLPQVYGLGAMQMFTPLSSNGGTTNSEFYLAQVPAFYAGKTLEISLWDPGDTNPLAATLYIERPTSSGWTTTPFTYSAQVGTTGGANSACNSNSNSSPSNDHVQTNVGATTGNFNGCWLTLEIPIPTSYGGDQDGWWKILYSMTGNGTSNDVTTWTAAIKGNPVHLVVP